MDTRIIWGIILILLLIVIAWFFAFSEDPLDTHQMDEGIAIENELDRLPHEIRVRNRTIVFDRSSIDQQPREEYAELPYEIHIWDEIRLVESETELLTGETPIEFIERILADLMPPREELDAYPETMYRYSVSFHPVGGDIVPEHPAADRADAEPAGAGLSAYVRSMNFPDDSVGGSENRYDFILSEDGAWILVFQGERNFCRRPGQEFWQPADQLCP